MLDKNILNKVDPVRIFVAKIIVKIGIKADYLSYAGALLGILAGFSIYLHWYFLAIALILLSRICDGLDGPVARMTKKAPRGAFIDAIADMVFYASILVGFAFAEQSNLLPAFLLAISFYFTGGSFLAQAAMRSAAGETDSSGKGIVYDRALMEGAETIGFYLLFCLLPNFFPVLALIFAGLCFVSFSLRIRACLK